MTNPPEPEVLQAIVRQVFRIDEVTLGEKDTYIVRYQGQLLSEDSQAAYEKLSTQLRAMKITPLFRLENGRQAIILVPGMEPPKPSHLSVNLALFLLTMVSVFFTGAMYSYQGPLPEDPILQAWTIAQNIWVGWPFAVSLLSILLAHELGHYFASRRHGVAVTLPYFIPFPLSLLGTMGAFINMKERPRNKRVLFDIGITGPLAGLAVALPVLVIGLIFSPTGTVTNTIYHSNEGITYTLADDNFLEGNSILYLALKYAVKGELLPAPASYGNLPPVLYWARYMLTGKPLPLGGMDVMLYPAALAGWAGLLVTFLNLIPTGQLDGGHILYTFSERYAKILYPIILAGIFALGFNWYGWWIWAGLIFLLGRTHAEPLDQITQLDTRRKVLAVATFIIFLLVLSPVPFTIF